MSFNKAINKETKELHKVLINAKAINATQYALLTEMIAFFDALTLDSTIVLDSKEHKVTEAMLERFAKRLYTRQELRAAHTILRNKRAAMYFVSKNVACKTKEHGIYSVSCLKLAANATKKIEAAKTEDAEIDAATAKTKKVKKVAAKKEVKAKREVKAKKEDAVKEIAAHVDSDEEKEEKARQAEITANMR